MPFGIHLADAVVRLIMDPSAFQKSLGEVDSQFKEFEATAKKAIVPFAAMTAAGTALIAKTTMTAARTEELGIVVENLGRVAGYSERELYDTEESIKKLGITTQSARTIMSRFIGAELDLAEASKVARAAQDLAVIGMQDSSTAAANLTYALASMQPRILRQYGLFINLNTVYKAAAEALGKTQEELTEAEKRSAFLNATLEQARNYAGTYEAAMETAGKQIRSFSRFVEESANKIGEQFLPALASIIDVATVVIKWFIDLPPVAHQAIAVILLVGTAFAGLMVTLSGFVLMAPTVAAAWALVLGPIGIIAAGIAVITGLALVHVKYQSELKKTREELLKTADSAEDYADKMLEKEKAILDAREAMGDYLVGLERQVLEEKRAGLIAEYYNEQVRETAVEIAKLTAIRQDDERAVVRQITADEIYEYQLENMEGAVRRLSDALRDMGGAWYSHISDIRDAADEYRELRDKVVSFGADTSEATFKYQRDVTRSEEDQLVKRTELLQKHAEKWEWVRSGHHARTKKEIAEVEAYWAQKLGEEVADFDAAYQLKRDRKEEDYQHSIEVAQRAATERNRIAEEEKAAELKRMEEAQQDRILMLAFEMMEYQNLLKLPIEGYEDMELSAEDAFAAFSTGLLDITPFLGALDENILKIGTDSAKAFAKGTDSADFMRERVQALLGDVMDISDPGLKNMAVDTETYVVQAGDTLGGLATKWGITVDEIMALNKDIVTDPNIIKLGQTLRTPYEETDKAVQDLKTEMFAMREKAMEGSAEIDTSFREEVIPAAKDTTEEVGYLEESFEDLRYTGEQTTEDLKQGIRDVIPPVHSLGGAVGSLRTGWVADFSAIIGKVKELITEVEKLQKALDDLPKEVHIHIYLHTHGSLPTEAQHGFHGLVTQPTLFLTGEKGTEMVDITPVGGSPAGRTGGGEEGGPAQILVEGDLIVTPEVLASPTFIDQIEEMRI